jgi:predicted RNA-binding protein with PUA-like domain
VNRWILKTDAEVYPFEELERERRTRWDGVSNPVALRNIRSMVSGDLLLIYHSGTGKEIVGLARVASEPYPDPKQKKPELVVVDIEVDRRLPRTVPLSAIKAEPVFAQSPLVRQPRLSVIPVSEEQWKKVLAMGGLS